MSNTYCITGISGYIGKLLAGKLGADSKNKVVGIDLKTPENLANVKFYQRDIRDTGIADILMEENVDVVIHLAFYTLPEGNISDAESINIGGTKNILQAAGAANVKRFVLASSSAAYGSHSDNPIPMNESQPLRPNKSFYYSYHKAAQEKLTQKFINLHPEIKVIILRPCVLIGPHINNPTGDSLKQKILIFIKRKQPPIQLIYEDDAVQAFYLAATNDAEGIYNIGGADTLTYPEIAKVMNKKIILLPFWLLCILANIGKWLRISPVGATTLKFIRNPVIVDPSKFNGRFNFIPRYDSKQALVRFIKAN